MAEDARAAEDVVSAADGPKQRLFLAVEMPRSAGKAVAAAIRPWREAFPNARWVQPENWHVTLKFLGWTPARVAPWVEETVEGIVAAHPPLPSRVRGLGAFPSLRRARVLWAGIDDPASGLAALVADLEAGLAEEFRQEMRRFHAHLTVARSEPPLHLPEPYTETPLASEPFVADRVVLFRSQLLGGATRYEPLRTFPLGG
jgi:2'-5' RNA ligase